jgi:hypothetical protein
MLALQDEVRRLMREALEEGVDYGVIPGTEKPSLWQSGAEKYCMAFGCYALPVLLEQEVDHVREVSWSKSYRDGGGKSGTAVGLYRYAYRVDIIHRETGTIVGSCVGVCSSLESKYCNRPRESEHVINMMAQKRALVGATRHAFGLSGLFTQDLEDFEDSIQRGRERPDRRQRPQRQQRGEHPASTAADAPVCPACGGEMWDNREANDRWMRENPSATRPRRPDWKCKAARCKGVFWRGQWPPNAPAEQEDASQTDGDLRALAKRLRELDPNAGDRALAYVEDVLASGSTDAAALHATATALRERIERRVQRTQEPSRSSDTAAEAAFGRMFAD